MRNPRIFLLKTNDMVKRIKGTKTEENMLKAFAGESQAKNRYEFASKVAGLPSL